MIELEFFQKLTDRQPHQHSVQPLDKLLKWTTSNPVLKQNTCQYRKFLTDNPFATKERKSNAKIYYFPTCTFSGTFSGTAKAEDIKNMSGLIVIDLDHIQKLVEVRQKLENDNYTYLMFTSPSNDGLKIVVKHNLTDPLKWQNLYFEIEAYYQELFKGYQDNEGGQLAPDRACKDINRMCFLPYIDNLYKNDNSQVWEYQATFEKPVKIQRVSVSDAQPLCKEYTDDLYKECFYISSYLFEYKICMTQNYEDWLLYGYSLCELGESGREIFHNISCLSEKYDPDTLDCKYDYLLKTYDPEKTGIDFYISNGKKAIAQHQLYVKYGFQRQ